MESSNGFAGRQQGRTTPESHSSKNGFDEEVMTTLPPIAQQWMIGMIRCAEAFPLVQGLKTCSECMLPLERAKAHSWLPKLQKRRKAIVMKKTLRPGDVMVHAAAVTDPQPMLRVPLRMVMAGQAIDGPINTPEPAHTRAKRPVKRMKELIVDQVEGSPAPPGRRRYHEHVDDVSEDEDEPEPLYADLPPHEDILRTNTRTRRSRRRQSSGMRITSRTVIRGGGGLDDDPEEARSDRDGPNFFRLRGGARAQPPTGMSPLSPGSDRIDTRPRKIE
jgi:hypothetical protein